MAFNSYAAGKKQYGMGRAAPNIGPVDPIGYKERDAQIKRTAVLRRIQASQKGDYMSANYLRKG